MLKTPKIIAAVIAIVAGILFIALRGDVISFVLTLLGGWLIISGVFDLVKGKTTGGAVKLVCGAVVILFGWTFVSAALYAIAALMVVFSIINLMSVSRLGGHIMSTAQKIRAYGKPVIWLIAGICLLFNQVGAIGWAFVIAGAVLIIEGILLLWDERCE